MKSRFINRRATWLGASAACSWLVLGLGTVLAQRPLGIDVSSYQGSHDTPPTNINWQSVAGSGIQFSWAKAAEGTSTDGYIGQDSDFIYNISNGKAAGVVMGAYYFAHPEADPGIAGADSEAAFFWSVAGPYMIADGLSLMPALDYETSPGSGFTQATSAQWVNEWCQDIENYRLNQPDEAGADLQRGLQIVQTNMPKPADLGLDWYDNSTTYLFLREAEQTVERKPSDAQK